MPGTSDSFWGAKSPRYSSLGLFTSRQLSLMDDGNAICFNYYRHFPHSVVGLRRRTANSCARYHLLAGGRSIARSLEWSASPKWSLRRIVSDIMRDRVFENVFPFLQSGGFGRLLLA